MNDQTVRINAYLADMGLCSRRKVAMLLRQKVVTINGVRVKEPGVRIKPHTDDIRLNGNRLRPPKLVYYLLNKPKGIVSTTSDEYGRENVTTLIPRDKRIYPVGRLDKDTSGLLLLTNDGTLTNLLTHPRYHVYKVYRLTIEGKVQQRQLEKLRIGVMLEDGMTAPAKVVVLQGRGNRSVLHMMIHEGRNRQIRRMCGTLGLNLIGLQRIQFGPIKIGDLAEGKYRELTEKEVQELKNTIKMRSK